MNLNTKKYENGVLKIETNEIVDYNHYLRCKDSVKFFRKLGGKETLRTKEGTMVLTSVSPCGTLKTIRTWIV